MQEICIGKNHARIFRYDKNLTDKVNKIIASNNNIIYIRTILKNKLLYRLSPIRVFDGTKQAKLTEGLFKKGNIVFNKYQGDAFSNPELTKFLKAQNIDTVEIIGLDGAGCVFKTALGALNNNLKVIINTAAIDTMFKKRQKRLFKLLKQKGATFTN